MSDKKKEETKPEEKKGKTPKMVPATPPAYPGDLPPTPPAYPMDTAVVDKGVSSKNVSPALGSTKPPPTSAVVPPPYMPMMPPPTQFLPTAQPFFPKGQEPAADQKTGKNGGKGGAKNNTTAVNLPPTYNYTQQGGQDKDATQFAAPEQNLPVILVYGLPLAGTTTLASQFAEQSGAVFLTSQSVEKAETWSWCSAVLTKFQQTLALAPKPIKSIVIDLPMKSVFELAYLVQWLKEHSIPLNASIYVDDGGSALKRAVATVDTAKEPEYEGYLKTKYHKGAAVISEIKSFFESQGINEVVKYPQDAEVKGVMLDFKFALAKARSRRGTKVCQSPQLPGLHRGLRPLLNADFYRTAMEVLLAAVWSGRKGAMNVLTPDEIVAKDTWEALFKRDEKAAAEANAKVESSKKNLSVDDVNLPLPSVRAQVGTPGLLFWHPKRAGEKRPNKLYFVPKGQAMLFTVDQIHWPFGNTTKPCVCTCSFVTGSVATKKGEASPGKADGAAEKEEEEVNSILLIQDCVYWDGASTFGKNYHARFGLLERAYGAQVAQRNENDENVKLSKVQEKKANGSANVFGFGQDPIAFPKGEDACDLVVGLHKAVSVRTLSNWRSAPKGKEAKEKNPWTNHPAPNIDRSQEYQWAKHHGVCLFDASANLSLYSSHKDGSMSVWIPPPKMTSVFKLGKQDKTPEGHQRYELLTLVQNKTEEKKWDLVPVPDAEANTVTIRQTELTADVGHVEGCELVELRWVQPRRKAGAGKSTPAAEGAGEGTTPEKQAENSSFTQQAPAAGHWKLIKFRPDRVNCDNWNTVVRVGTILPAEKQIDTFSNWLKFAIECVPPTSQALQDLMSGTAPTQAVEAKSEERDRPKSGGGAKKGRGRKK